MKRLFILLTITFLSTKCYSGNSFWSGKINLYNGFIELVGEESGDSMLVNYIYRDQGSHEDFSFYLAPETIYLGKLSHKNDRVKVLNQARDIIELRLRLHAQDSQKFEDVALQKVDNKSIYPILNKCLSSYMNKRFRDSASKILQTVNEYPGIKMTQSINKKIENMRPDAFRSFYSSFIAAEYSSVELRAQKKMQTLNAVISGQQVIDTVFIKSFYKDYLNCHADNMILFYIIINKPAMFYACSWNEAYYNIYSAIAFNQANFSREQVKIIYSVLKPMSEKNFDRIDITVAIWELEKLYDQKCLIVEGKH